MGHMKNQYDVMKREHGIDEMLKDSEDSEADQYIGKSPSIIKVIFQSNTNEKFSIND